MNAQNTRKRILDAAQRLIERGGFTRLTTKNIAQEAECSEGTLFKHFGTKENLCLAVILENSPSFMDALRRPNAGRGSVHENLKGFAVAAIRFSEKLIPAVVPLLADAKLLARHRGVKHRGERGAEMAFQLVADYVAEEQKIGRISTSAKPLFVAAVLMGPCFHWVFFRHAMGTSVFPSTDDKFVTGLVDTIMTGISIKQTSKRT